MTPNPDRTAIVPGLQTRVAMIEGITGTQKEGISIIRLSDGSALRMHTASARAAMQGLDNTRPMHSTIAYDVDAAGNRFNPRVATPADIRNAVQANPLAQSVRRVMREIRK